MSRCGSSSVGRVSAFQADCREFESRLPLHFLFMATWPSGKAEACKAFTPGSNPGVAFCLQKRVLCIMDFDIKYHMFDIFSRKFVVNF